jgi:hypothetical protein
VVPLGLSNEPTIFMCLMNGIFRNYLDTFSIVLSNDILIYSKYKFEHDKHLRMVLQVLRKDQDSTIYQAEKMLILLEVDTLFGHIILEKGIVVDIEEIKSIEEWTIPNNFSKVISFMGLVSYYRIFIDGFSRISHPITSLQKKGVKFEWTSECEKNFQHLNDLMTSSPILRIDDPNEYFITCTNSFKEVHDGVLSQNGH